MRGSPNKNDLNSTHTKMLDPDLDEYLSEYRLQAPAEPVSHYEGMYTWRTIANDSCVCADDDANDFLFKKKHAVSLVVSCE